MASRHIKKTTETVSEDQVVHLPTDYVNWVVEEAKGIDARKIHECNKRSLPVVYTAREYIMWILSKKHLVYTAKIGEEVVGYILLREEPHSLGRKKGHIMSIAIDKKERKRGIGKHLVDEVCKKTIDEFKVNVVTLNVMKINTDAIAFYKRLGFKNHQKLRKYYGKGKDGVMMIKQFDVDVPGKTELSDNLEDYMR